MSKMRTKEEIMGWVNHKEQYHSDMEPKYRVDKVQDSILEILFDVRDLLAQSTIAKRLENHLRYPRGSGKTLTE